MNVKLSSIIKHRATLPTVVGALSFGGGLVLGYILGQRSKTEDNEPETVDQAISQRDERLAAIREQVAESRAQRAARMPPVVIDAEEYEKREQAKRDKVTYDELVEPYQGTDPEAEVTVNGAPIDHSIFADSGEDWDMEAEVKLRTPDRPYVIHKEEFFEEGEDYNQRQLTYYNGDDVLVDEDNHEVENHVKVVGEMRFGHGSGDPNVVYIRNEKLKSEYEVFLHAGHYAIEILGMEADDGRDIQHSGVRRMPRE